MALVPTCNLYAGPTPLSTVDKQMFIAKSIFKRPRGCIDDYTYSPTQQQWNVSTSIVAHSNDTEYKLSEFHLHQPSENIVDQKQYPIELHIDFLAADGTYYTISILAHVSKHRTSRIFRDVINNRPFAVPRLSSYWSYPSAFTSGTTTTAVNINVSAHIKSITAKDLETLKSKSVAPRPPQPRAGRIITFASSRSSHKHQSSKHS
jgi:carbonic anhydrase